MINVFERLNEYGVEFTDSSKPMLHVEENQISSEDFFNQSSELLKEIAPIIREEFIPNLEQYEGRWHPSGFMVYPLGAHPVLGTLRFHVWPKGMRKRLEKGRGDMGYVYDGDIHNHAWNITSLAMEYYKDLIFNVQDSEIQELTDDEVNARGLFRVFNVTYGEDVKQALVTAGRIVRADVIQEREALRNEIHTIDVGVFHSPTIPDDVLGSTLVFDSFRLSDGPDVLIGGDQLPIFDRRRPISQEEALEVKRQFINSNVSLDRELQEAKA